MRGAIKKCVNSWSRRWEGSKFSQIKVCFYYPWVGGGPGGGFKEIMGFLSQFGNFSWLCYTFHMYLRMHYCSACDDFEKKPFHSSYGFIILLFSGIFRAIKRSKLELQQINMQFNFDQFRALNFQNRTNGSKVMVILPLQVRFWKYKGKKYYCDHIN